MKSIFVRSVATQRMDLKWSPRSFLWLILCISGGLLLVLNSIQLPRYPIKSTLLQESKEERPDETHLKGFLVRTPGCQIPDMDPMDASVAEYIFQESKVVCNGGVPALVGSNMTSLFVIESSLGRYKVNDTDLLTCCFQPFVRAVPKRGDKDDAVEFDKSCYTFSSSADVLHEFVKVKCTYNNTEIYKDFFDFVPLKNTSNNTVSDKHMNVLIVGIDAVSRLNFHRQMPETVEYLRKLGAVEMLGYNKVGDNTFPNLIPVLTGLTEDELRKVCWPNHNSYFDKCPFIWNNYKEAGYSTTFGEDSSWMGLFYYTRKGFLNQPTDYFWDAFNRIAERQIGNKHRLNVDQCVGARSVYKVFVDYISKFTQTMHENNRRYFAFFWGASLSHDFLNKPKLGDEDYRDMLQRFDLKGLLNNTALIFLSDHGIRWGSIRSTYQGRMEERLPFLFVRLPEWYTSRRPYLVGNLKTNKRRLTTPFDLHETLKDLLHSDNLTDQALRSRSGTGRRGYSLFEPISDNRTCDDAAISSHWCTCQTSKQVDVEDPVVQEAANYTVEEHINELLVGYADCARLKLNKTLDARLHTNGKELLKDHFSEDYTITFTTEPGGAVFEATVRKYTSDKKYYFKVTGTVSRINLYGSQSKCMSDFHLKLYCYCRNYLSRNQ